MTSDLSASPLPTFGPLPSPGMLTIKSSSYEDRRVICPAVSVALDMCGCWLLGSRPTSVTGVEFHFEVLLDSAVDLYAMLVAAGLEFSRASHHDLTMLCMVHKHQESPRNLASVMTVQLAVNFLEDAGMPITSTAFGHA